MVARNMNIEESQDKRRWQLDEREAVSAITNRTEEDDKEVRNFLQEYQSVQ